MLNWEVKFYKIAHIKEPQKQEDVKERLEDLEWELAELEWDWEQRSNPNIKI